MATRIEQLLSLVKAEVTLDDSILSLLAGFGDVLRELRADVASQGFNPVAVDRAIADLTTKQAAMLAAVKAGTELLNPPASPEPTTEAEPPPGESPSLGGPADGHISNSKSGPPEMTLASEPEASEPEASEPEAPAPSNTPLPGNDPATTATDELPPNKVQADENAGQADEPGPAAPAQGDGSGTPLTGDPELPGSSVPHT